jgi:drug/metabolite transporter (DMT)-like permease
MRTLQILGAILIAAGLFLIIRPPSYPHQESVFKLGDLEATVQDRRTVPGWVGGVLLGAGCVLVIVGLKKSS